VLKEDAATQQAGNIWWRPYRFELYMYQPVICLLVTVTKCIFFSNSVKFEDVTIVTIKSVMFLDMTWYNPVLVISCTTLLEDI